MEIFRAVYRFDVLQFMKEGVKIELPKSLKPFDRNVISYWKEQYNYDETESKNRGFVILEPKK